VELKIVPITKYRVELVNHGVAWELYGIRLSDLSHVRWLLERQYKELVKQESKEKLEPGFDPFKPSPTVRQLDLLCVALSYLQQAEACNVALPHVPAGEKAVVQIGPGVYLVAETFSGGAVPLYDFEKYN
jgi:hypothetical protein